MGLLGGKVEGRSGGGGHVSAHSGGRGGGQETFERASLLSGGALGTSSSVIMKSVNIEGSGSLSGFYSTTAVCGKKRGKKGERESVLEREREIEEKRERESVLERERQSEKRQRERERERERESN